MTDYKIELASKEYMQELTHIAKEFKDNPSRFDLEHRNLIVSCYENGDFTPYFTKVENSRKGIVPEGKVAASYLFVIKEEKIIAIANIRHELNDYLRNVLGGHIGYEMVPAYRGKGLMNKIAKCILAYARDNLGITQALITCKEENIPSLKIITRLMHELGGYPDTDTLVDGKVNKRCWIETKNA